MAYGCQEVEAAVAQHGCQGRQCNRRRLAMRFSWLLALAGLALALSRPASLPADDAAPAAPSFPGLGDPGALQSLSIDFGLASADRFTLSGRDARQQLVGTGNYSTGQVRDL